MMPFLHTTTHKATHTVPWHELTRRIHMWGMIQVAHRDFKSKNVLMCSGSHGKLVCPRSTWHFVSTCMCVCACVRVCVLSVCVYFRLCLCLCLYYRQEGGRASYYEVGLHILVPTHVDWHITHPEHISKYMP